MNSQVQKDNSIHEDSFEWLTNFTSLAPLLNPFKLFPDTKTTTTTTGSKSSKRVLHIGCGTSTLGIELHRTFPNFYEFVLNVDNDVDIIRQMSNRWKALFQTHDEKKDRGIKIQSCSFEYMNVNDYCQYNNTITTSKTQQHILELPSPNTFDLILDKSTLDCLLCSHNGTCGLLSCIHHHLKPGGVYFLVTFHHVDFILPLIRDCPGIEWNDIQYYTVQRNVDSPQVLKALEERLYQHDLDSLDLDPIHDDVSSKIHIDHTSPWSSGTFEPNDNYKNFVTVFVCTRRKQEENDQRISNIPFNFQLMTKHVRDCNNQYFQKNNPLVTLARQEELHQKFTQEVFVLKSQKDVEDDHHTMDTMSQIDQILPLDRVYHILFTEYEREEYTFDDFVLDWESYQENNHGKTIHNVVGMSFETTIDFLKTMQ